MFILNIVISVHKNFHSFANTSMTELFFLSRERERVEGDDDDGTSLRGEIYI